MNEQARDPLTGVFGRAAYDDWIRTAADVEQPVTFIIIDVDHFKRINDTLGHPVGDAALKGVGELLRRLVDRYTSANVFRYGGDEFVVTMAGYSVDEARALVATIVSQVASLRVEELTTPITLSIGLTTTQVSPLERLLHDADEALRAAKRNGRNRLEVFAQAATAPPAPQRLVLNPALFNIFDKKLRLAFVRTARYQHAVDMVATRDELPLKCVSVLGRTDLLIVHLGDREHRFLADLEPLLRADDATDERTLVYFEVSRIAKFHGFDLTGVKPPRKAPDRDTVKRLVEYAEGRSDADAALVKKWVAAGYALGLEARDTRGVEIEAYVTVDVLVGRDDEVNRELFDVVLKEDILPEPHVVSVYEGHGVNTNAQFVIRTRSAPSELFDLIEYIHKRCIAYGYLQSALAHTW